MNLTTVCCDVGSRAVENKSKHMVINSNYMWLQCKWMSDINVEDIPSCTYFFFPGKAFLTVEQHCSIQSCKVEDFWGESISLRDEFWFRVKRWYIQLGPQGCLSYKLPCNWPSAHVKEVQEGTSIKTTLDSPRWEYISYCASAFSPDAVKMGLSVKRILYH